MQWLQDEKLQRHNLFNLCATQAVESCITQKYPRKPRYQKFFPKDYFVIPNFSSVEEQLNSMFKKQSQSPRRKKNHSQHHSPVENESNRFMIWKTLIYTYQEKQNLLQEFSEEELIYLRQVFVYFLWNWSQNKILTEIVQEVCDILSFQWSVDCILRSQRELDQNNRNRCSPDQIRQTLRLRQVFEHIQRDVYLQKRRMFIQLKDTEHLISRLRQRDSMLEMTFRQMNVAEIVGFYEIPQTHAYLKASLGWNTRKKQDQIPDNFEYSLNHHLKCQFHQEQTVTLCCLRMECVKTSLMCTLCIQDRHENHPFVSIRLMANTLDQFRRQNRILENNQKNIARTVCRNFTAAFNCFTALTERVKSLAFFMDAMMQDMLFNGDEGKVAYELVKALDESDDTQYVHQKFDELFRNCTLELQKNGEMKVNSYQEQKNKFSGSLRGQTDIVFREFESFFARVAACDKKHKAFTRLKIQASEDERNVAHGKAQLTPFYMNQVRLQQKTFLESMKAQQAPSPLSGSQFAVKIVKQNEDDMRDESQSVCESAQQSYGESSSISMMNGKPRKLVFKLYSYFIFYYAIQCDAIVPEPVIGGPVLKKVNSGELKIPIRCLFCKLNDEKRMEYYFKFELILRFGKLCLFRTQNGSDHYVDIYAHEMCMLWSNSVYVDHDNFTVQIPTIIKALNESRQIYCYYCQHTGASTRCQSEECDIAFHFHCFKLIHLQGVKLDEHNRYRYYCDAHARTEKPPDVCDWYMITPEEKILFIPLLSRIGQSQVCMIPGQIKNEKHLATVSSFIRRSQEETLVQ